MKIRVELYCLGSDKKSVDFLFIVPRIGEILHLNDNFYLVEKVIHCYIREKDSEFSESFHLKVFVSEYIGREFDV